jgi:exodeoxyribonuclease V alpha subunit
VTQDLLNRLDAFRERGVLADLDVEFARFVARLAGEATPEVVLAAALVSRDVERGHVCADLAALAGTVVLPGADDDPVDGGPVVAPPLARWRAALEASPLVGGEGLLVLDPAGRLYLQRYWRHEQALAAALLARAADVPAVDEARLRADLGRLFPRAGDGPDWQQVAAATAVLRRLCVVSGGPGTGKTSTVVRVLALLASQSDQPLRIGLVAPTGKAAARLQESIRATRAALAVDEAVRARIPDEASTIHRLLGARRDSTAFRHDAGRPLALDVLVVDEASMVDLALMARLVAALPAAARLVLLGDRDQLASVEAGAVLGDVCGPAPGFSAAFHGRLEALVGAPLPAGRASTSALADCVVLLTESRRFGVGSGIGRVARAVNAGAGEDVVSLLDDPAVVDAGRADGSEAALTEAVLAGYAAYHARVAADAPPAEVFEAFRAFRVLCAPRRGPRGAETINARVTAVLGVATEWWAGRPVLITQNDYALRLFNGDVGITLHDPAADGRLRVFFEGEEGKVRRIPPLRLPPHQTTYAMTIHKSQGSEFDRVLLVLPEADSRLATRELLYTGLTRARTAVTVWGDVPVIRAAVERRLVRSSGLRDSLWGRDLEGAVRQ